MANAKTRGWGDPDARGFSRNIVRLDVAGTFVHVHRAVAPIFRFLLTELNKVIELQGEPHDDWGYNNRDVRGRPGVKSNHSWGLAVDLNATRNPMTSNPNARRQFKTQHVDPILKQLKGLVEWGGDYRGERKDYMHFEFIGTPKQAAALCDFLATKRVEKIMATLDDDDLKAIEQVVDKVVTKHARTILGNADEDKDSPTHTSLADLRRLLKSGT